MTAKFHGKLAEHLDFGHVLEIGAKAENDASWFSISLATAKLGDDECDTVDTGLCISVYLKEDQIVFKQQIDKNWKEVATEDTATEIFHQHFKIVVVMDEDKFHVSVNSEQLLFVKYALPIEQLNTLHIIGDLTSIKQIDHRRYFPYAWPPLQMTDNRLDFSHDIPLMLQPGHVMVLTMKLRGEMTGRFQLQFQNIWDCRRQEVHISTCFESKQIARNSKLQNADKMEFGIEETDGAFPFELYPVTFKLALGFTATSVKMAKDGVFLFEYAFRTSNVLCDLSGVKIKGTQGMTVRVSAIDHHRLQDPLCEGFEQYSKR